MRVKVVKYPTFIPLILVIFGLQWFANQAEASSGYDALFSRERTELDKANVHKTYEENGRQKRDTANDDQHNERCKLGNVQSKLDDNSHEVLYFYVILFL